MTQIHPDFSAELASLAHAGEIISLAEVFHREDGHPLAPTGAAALKSLLAGSPLGKVFRLSCAGECTGYFVVCFTMSIEFGGLVIILDDLYVRPEYRSRGAGTWVLSQLSKMADELGAVQIFLEVENSNQKAFTLYQRHGFHLRDRRMMERNFSR